MYFNLLSTTTPNFPSSDYINYITFSKLNLRLLLNVILKNIYPLNKFEINNILYISKNINFFLSNSK